VEPTRQTSEDEEQRPRDRDDDGGGEAPESDHPGVWNEEDRAKHDCEAPAAQRLVVGDSDASTIHASGYRTRVLRALPLLLAVAVLAGCGGGGGGDALTREQYAQKADAVCTKYKNKTDDLGNPANLSDLADVADKVIPILHDARNELRQLKPPANEEGTADDWLDEFDVIIDDVEKIRDKARDNDTAAVRRLAQPALEHDQKANDLATRLGMTVCNKD
jgi:hypothetical protein